MKSATAIVLAVVVAMAAASVLHTDKDYRKMADKDLLVKQKNILQLFVRVHHKNHFPEISEIGNTYRLEANLDHYKDAKYVKDFLAMYETEKMLQRGEIFSVLEKTRRDEAILLFDMFYHAKDYETFYKTACWARDRVNEGQFVYALSVALLQREDTKDIVLPPVYEIYPYLFVDNTVIQEAIKYRMRGADHELTRPFVIPVNRTGCYDTYDKTYCDITLNKEELVSYFTEDIGLNAFNAYWHLDYPFWANTKEYNTQVERRGELFTYVQRQLLARYTLERLSNDLPEITPFKWTEPIKTGYYPKMSYHNGQEVPMRPDGIHMKDIHQCKGVDMCKDIEYLTVKDLALVEERLLDAIDLGYVITKEGNKVPLTEEKGINILGDLFYATEDSLNKKFYGSLYTMIMTMMGRIVDPMYYHGVAPGVMQHFASMLRDPMYYRVMARLDQLLQKYEMTLPHYSKDDLYFPGVKVDSVDVDKLVTYFEKYDFNLDNVVDISRVEEGDHIDIRARQIRINHKPFTYRVQVTSDKATTLLVRVFLGPKYDHYGNELDINAMRKYMVELDKFPTKVQVGKNVIERNSRDSTVTSKDQTSTRTLFRQVNNAIAGKEPFYLDQTERQCGYPDRMLLPKGKKAGMPFTMFVMVTPFEDKMTQTKSNIQPFELQSLAYCGVGYNNIYPDSKPMGYPFERQIHEVEFVTPNMMFKDVFIFHKKIDNANNFATQD